MKFTFGQTGNIFIKDGVQHKIYNRTQQTIEALRTGLNNLAVDIEKEIDNIYAEKQAKKQAFSR